MARTSGRTHVPKIFADDPGANSVSTGHDLSWFRRVSHAWSPEDRRVWLWTWFVGAHLRQQRAPKRGAGGSQEGGSGAKKPRQDKVAATTCRHSGCSSHGSHGVPGTRNPVFCPRHAAAGMVQNDACNTLGGRGGGRASGGGGSAGNGGGGGGGGNGESTTPTDTDEGGDGGDGDGIDGDGGGGDIPMDIGNSDDGDSGGGDSDSSDGKDGVKITRKRKPAGTASLFGPDLAKGVAAPALPCIGRIIANNRSVSDGRVEQRKGTAPRAPKRPGGVGTVADVAKPLALLSGSSKDGIKIMEGVYFPRKKMGRLKPHYVFDYVYDPSNIGVIVGETEVAWGGTIQKVASFDHGVYTLEDKETLTQWQLLRNRCGDGVTLEQDLARYIRQLALTYVVMKRHGVPQIENDGNMNVGMILDVGGGLAGAEASSDGIDPVSKLGIEELGAIKSKADRALDFALKIFTGSSVRDILPVPDVIGDEGKRSKPAEEFIKRPGSLKELNFMSDLGCSDQPGTLLKPGHLFDGKLVRGGSDWVPKADSENGAWEAKLRMIIKLLMCAYRLDRAVNLIEAYLGLSPGELKVLKEYNPFWGKNMAAIFDGLPFDNMVEHIVSDEQLDGKNGWACRLAVERSRALFTYLTPVVVDASGTRDPFEYGTLSNSSLDTGYIQNMRSVYNGLLKRAMGLNSPSLSPVIAVLDTSLGLFSNSRRGRTERNAQINGAIGEGSKSRRNKLILVDDPVDRRFASTMTCQMSLGEQVRPLMEAVVKICPDFEFRATNCLVGAKSKSCIYHKQLLKDGSRRLVDVVGEDHLLGGTPEQQAAGKKWIAGVVEGLEAAGFTCQDICRFSVSTQVGILHNSAYLRNKDYYHLQANTLYYKNDLGTIVMRPPAPPTKSSRMF
ncbi:unnamed protein product [Pylaiella littoralis]